MRAAGEETCWCGARLESREKSSLDGTCNIGMYMYNITYGTYDVQIQCPWRISQASAPRCRRDDVQRNRKDHTHQAAGVGTQASTLVEQQSRQQRDDEGLDRSRLQKRASGLGRAQACLPPRARAEAARRRGAIRGEHFHPAIRRDARAHPHHAGHRSHAAGGPGVGGPARRCVRSQRSGRNKCSRCLWDTFTAICIYEKARLSPAALEAMRAAYRERRFLLYFADHGLGGWHARPRAAGCNC